MVSFSVCGGLTNQRLAIVNTVVFAKLLKMSVHLPRLSADGTQLASRGYAEPKAAMVPFSDVYSVRRTVRRLSRIVSVSGVAGGTTPACPSCAVVRLLQGRMPMRWWRVRIANESRTHEGQPLQLEVGCHPLGLLPKLPQEIKLLFWRVDAALVFAEHIEDAADSVVRKLRERSVCPAVRPSLPAPASL